MEAMPESGLRAQYHHGDLRNALCRHALRIIETKGAGELSLRDTARVLGVSVSAVYRHFKDKADLIAAVVDDGVARLRRAMESAAAVAEERANGVASAAASLVAMGVAYVRFAAAHPSHFDAMSAAGVLADARGPREILVRAVDRVMGKGSPVADRRAARQAAFAAIHGLAVLVAGGVPEEREPAACELSAREVLAVVLRGFHRAERVLPSPSAASPLRPSPARLSPSPRRAKAGQTRSSGPASRTEP
jgi:AcrR family transcriptional regulator